MAEYDSRFIQMIGAPRTGKSSRADELMHFFSGPNGRGLIILADDKEEIWHKYPVVKLETPEDFKNQKGYQRFVFPFIINKKKRNQMYYEFFIKLFAYWGYGTLLLDDVRTYIGSSSIESFDIIQRKKRQMYIDIIAVAHGFTEVPPVFYTFATDIWLFRTEDNPDRKIENIPNPDKLKLLKDYVDWRGGREKFYYYPLKKEDLPYTTFPTPPKAK